MTFLSDPQQTRILEHEHRKNKWNEDKSWQNHKKQPSLFSSWGLVYINTGFSFHSSQRHSCNSSSQETIFWQGHMTTTVSHICMFTLANTRIRHKFWQGEHGFILYIEYLKYYSDEKCRFCKQLWQILNDQSSVSLARGTPWTKIMLHICCSSGCTSSPSAFNTFPHFTCKSLFIVTNNWFYPWFGLFS